MALVTKTYTFTAGTTIVASEHNTNFDTLYNLVNGNIDNANIKASAGIVDSKLAQVTTAGKVSGAALTSLTSIPSGAGLIPVANIDTGTTASKILQLDGSAKIPAVDGSQITNIGGLIGTAVSKSDNTAYQATTDGFLIGLIDCGGATGTYGDITGYTDSSNPPTTVMAYASGWRVDSTFSGSSGNRKNSFCMPVKKNNYYKGTLTTGAGSPTATYYFIPLGA
jgi:hypothetical protein